MRDLGGGGLLPPPKSRLDGGAGTGLTAGDLGLLSGRPEGSVYASGRAISTDSISVGEGRMPTGGSGDCMEDGELSLGLNTTSCDSGLIGPILPSSGKDVQGGSYSLETEDMQVAKYAMDRDCLALHAATGGSAPLLPHSTDVCMGMTNGIDTAVPTPISHESRSLGVCVNVASSAKQHVLGPGGTASLPNCWNSKAMPWKKPRVVPLPSLEELGQFSTEDDVAILDEDAIDDTLKKLEHAIVGRMFGRRIPFSVLSGELSRRWGGLGKFRLVTLSSDCFICVFENSEACNFILLEGPWVILGQVLGVDRWTPTFSPSSLDGFRTPVWIRMPCLPLYCWSSVNIARITAHIGEPMWMDSATDQLEKGIFARACVRLDLSKPLKSGIWVQGRHGKFFQSLEYEGLSIFCYLCSQVGHKASSCKSSSSSSGRCKGSPPVAKCDDHVPLVAQDLSAGTTHEMDEPCHGSVTRPKALCRDDSKDDGCQPKDCGVGPWMMVTRKKQSPKKNGKASFVKPAASHKVLSGPVVGTNSFRQGMKPTFQDFPPMFDISKGSHSPIGWMDNIHCMDGVSPQVMRKREPLPEEENHPVSLEFKALPKRDRQLGVIQSLSKPKGSMKDKMMKDGPTFTCFKALSEGALGRSSRTSKAMSARASRSFKEKMVSDLGPVAPGSRKRQKAHSLTDGGDGSSTRTP